MSNLIKVRSKIPQPFLDELLSKTDIVELIDSFVPLKKRGQSFIACCPFHNEKTPSFNVVAKKQFYHCFGCGASGNAISFAMNYLNQGFIDAVETLSSRVGMVVPRENNEKTQQSTNLYNLLQQINQYYQKNLRQTEEAITYLKNRGLNGEVAKKYDLGYAPAGWSALEASFKRYRNELILTGMLIKKDDGKTYDRYRHRIMFPIHDRHGRIIGFGGRSIDNEQKPKYLNSPETVIFQKNRELYGLHQILQQDSTESILIVEGYLDVIALAQHGINNAVAALGTATSTYHIQLLSKHTKKIIFCFDGDSAGRQAAWRALENTLPQMDNGLDARFVFLPDNHDPDSLVRSEGADALRQRIHEAIPLNQYFLNTLAEDIDTQTAAGKSRLLTMAKPLLQTMPDSSYKQLLIAELARIIRIENHRIEQIITSQSIDTTEKPRSQKPIKRSPIRVALALLIQHPELYSACKQHIAIEKFSGKDLEILQKILQTIAKHPQINTATLIEHWRDTPLFDSLAKLAGWEHQVPEHALVKEFIDIMLFLQKKENLANKINEYIAKSRKQGLTDSERLILQDLIKRQHQTADDKK